MSIAEKFEIIADEVYAKGVEVGKSQGGDTEEAYNQGFEAGKQEQYNDFWDNYQQNGTRKDYQLAFGSVGWNKNTFKPKYDIKPSNGYMMFRYFNNFSTYEPIDLVEHLNSLGVSLDLSNLSTATYLFQGAKISRLGVISFEKCGALENPFINCSYLETIEELIFSDIISQVWYNAFTGCSKLKNVNSVKGVIRQDADLSACPLTAQSAINFINVLKDYNGTSTTRTLSLSSTTKSLLTETDIATITQKGWTLA